MTVKASRILLIVTDASAGRSVRDALAGTIHESSAR
jgi:hypothetical protein